MVTNKWVLLILNILPRHWVDRSVKHTAIPVMYAAAYSESHLSAAALISSYKYCGKWIILTMFYTILYL